MRNSLSHPKNDFEGIRSHIPTKLLRLSLVNICIREIAQLTGSSPHWSSNDQGLFGARPVTPIVGRLFGTGEKGSRLELGVDKSNYEGADRVS